MLENRRNCRSRGGVWYSVHFTRYFSANLKLLRKKSVNLEKMLNIHQPFHFQIFKRTENICPHTGLKTNVHSSFIFSRSNWKQSKHPSTDDWINKLWKIHTMDHYSAIKAKNYQMIQNNYVELKIRWNRGVMKEMESFMVMMVMFIILMVLWTWIVLKSIKLSTLTMCTLLYANWYIQ